MIFYDLYDFMVIVCVLYVSHTTELNETNMGIRKLPVAPFTAPSGNTTKKKVPKFYSWYNLGVSHIWSKNIHITYGKFMV